jgi:peptidoglycan/LPS O-acetylase OafA/YrhL
MRSTIHWIVSIAAAGVIGVALQKLLPADMARTWVIAISGVAGILWYIFIDRPLKAWAQK